jgi:hypothetical protein
MNAEAFVGVGLCAQMDCRDRDGRTPMYGIVSDMPHDSDDNLQLFWDVY